MLFSGDYDTECLKKLQEPAKLVNKKGLQVIKTWNKVKRSQTFMEIEINIAKLDKNECGRFGDYDDIYNSVSGTLYLAQLMLATAAYVNNEEKIGSFSDKELTLIEELERYEHLLRGPVDRIVEMIGNKENGIDELITEYYQRSYDNIDNIIMEPIQVPLEIAINNKYDKVQKKIKDVTLKCIERYGLTWLKKGILVSVKESEQIREEMSRESQKTLEEFKSKLNDFEPIKDENLNLKNKISQLGIQIIKKDIENEAALKELESLESEKQQLDNKYYELFHVFENQQQSIDEKHKELERREIELEGERLEYKKIMEEEKEKIVKTELEKISQMKNSLENEQYELISMKQEAELKDREFNEQLEHLNEIITGKLEGNLTRYVSAEDAKLYELNYIARFDDKMHNFPLKLHDPLENKKYGISSWENCHYHFNSIEEIFQNENTKYSEIVAVNPINSRSIYVVEEKKYKFFGEKARKVVIEAFSCNHLNDYIKYGFDTKDINLSEFLIILSKSINSAAIGKYLHVIGLASPTGWDGKVINEIQSKEFAHNYISKYVSVCLIDSLTGEVYYNPNDKRIISYIDFFKPEYKAEKVERNKSYILEKFKLNNYVAFEDVVKETNEDRMIIQNVFYKLENEGVAKQRYVKGVGLVLESVG